MSEPTSSPLPPSAAPERLQRRLDTKMVGGVAGGLARYFDVDVSLVRLGFVVLAIFGGSGLLLYLIAWLIMPSDDAPATESCPQSERTAEEPPITVQPTV